MDHDVVGNSLIALWAYDDGSLDSGVHDEVLRQECIDCLNAMDGPTFRKVISRLARESFLSEKDIEQGYGIAEVLSFTSWLNERMGQDVEGTY